MKICPNCKLNLKNSCFHKCKSRKDGLHTRCKACQQNYYKKRIEQITAYKQLNSDKIKKYNHQYNQHYYIQHKDYIKVSSKQWKSNNESRRKQYNRQYFQDNKERRNKYLRDKSKKDINFRITKNLRNRLYIAIRRGYKVGSAIRDLGISIPEFKLHIEAQFRDDMTWENWGKVWHLDHIKPLALFDLTNRNQFLEAANWKNYQPLFRSENLSKGKKY